MIDNVVFLDDIFKMIDGKSNIKVVNLCKDDSVDCPVEKICFSSSNNELYLTKGDEILEETWKVVYDPNSVSLGYTDLFHILKQANTIENMKEYEKLFIRRIPGYARMIGYDQNNAYHQYALDDHSLHTVLNLAKDIEDDMLYLAALIHDIGKPDARCKGRKSEDTQSHYYNHPEMSWKFVKNTIIPFMEQHGYIFKEGEKERLLYYVRYHDDHLSLKPKHLLKHLKLTDFGTFQKLMELQIADAKAHVMYPAVFERIRICQLWKSEYGLEIYNEIKNGKIR